MKFNEDKSYKERSTSYSKEYEVVLVAPNYVVYKDGDTNRFKKGKFDVKVGDKIKL